MYRPHSEGCTISLWCDGRTQSDSAVGGKRKQDDVSAGRRAINEKEVDNVFKDLREKHGNEYDAPKLHVWARMISSGIHDDYDSPPDVPMFLTPSTKKTRKEPLSEVLHECCCCCYCQEFGQVNPYSNSTVGLTHKEFHQVKVSTSE